MSINTSKYELVFEREVADLSSTAFLLKHKKSGARVFILSNDDDNKCFYIGFRTPPADSTGVAHIMEHSVLCGSEKFPLKDPFVELAKGSLNTFLNAMTYPDKTVYPVASCNDKDFRNLMDVYMDAVFHPNIYIHPEILKQEGWNYHIESPDEPITYNGVVYNEMKGAFSSPDDVLMRSIFNSLFPDTAYGVESGGDPECIPDLTYDDFLDFHRRYYHPSNSYIYLYGDMDIEEQLEWMDSAYLSAYERIETDSEIALQRAFSETHNIEGQYPVTDDESEEDNTYLSYNMVCGSIMDIKKVYAMQMLVYALIDTQGAPIRQRLLDEGIGKDILSSFDDGVLQPYLSIISKNANASQRDAFLNVIREEMERAATEGLNRKSLIASLNSLKFKYREADFGGFPKGLVYGLSALNSWLYDEKQPLLHIELGSVFDELEKELDTDYYENIIRELLLGNEHSSVVVLEPEKGLTAAAEARTAQKLADFKASLNEEQISDLIEQTRHLAEYQEEPSTKEELETIPLLTREDMKREPRTVSNIEDSICGIPFIRHEYATNGIAYISLMFDDNGLPKELIPYAGLLKSIISFVNTEKYSYSELNNEINIYTGGFGFDTGVYYWQPDNKRFSLLSDLSVRVMYENIDKAFDLIEEVLFTGKYEDPKRLYEIIAELKSRLQMSLMSAGHVAASLRAASYYSENSALKEQINGIEFYKFVERLEKNYEQEKDTLISNIKAILADIIDPSKLLISCTADGDGFELVRARCEIFAERLAKRQSEPKEEQADFRDRRFDFYGKGFVLGQLNEAFKTSGTVNYVARAGRFIDDINDLSGAFNVFQTVMRFEYLWFNIRVQGGAYGCMCGSRMDGGMHFVTYRDPHIRRSNDIFEGVPEYLESFDCDEREMTKYVIGTMSGADTPMTPAQRGTRDLNAYLQGESQELKVRIRNEIIDCSSQDIRALAPMIKRMLEGQNICVLGCESKIAEDVSLFKNVRNLFEN